MKYLKKFNEELKPSTYRSAADSLQRMGHKKRASNIRDWSDKVEKMESEKIKSQSINLLKEFGSFKLIYFDSGKEILTGNFFINISSHDYYQFVDTYLDLIDENGNFKHGDFLINFDIGFIPADEETSEKFYNYERLNNDAFWNSMYWNMILGISIIRNGEKYINPNGDYYIDGNDRDRFTFFDRKEALNFRKLLSDAFLGNNDWGKNEHYTSLKESILKTFEKVTKSPYFLPSDVFNEESYQKIANSIKSISLNKLYRE
jgi:hypothetical protein